MLVARAVALSLSYFFVSVSSRRSVFCCFEKKIINISNRFLPTVYTFLSLCAFRAPSRSEGSGSTHSQMLQKWSVPLTYINRTRFRGEHPVGLLYSCMMYIYIYAAACSTAGRPGATRHRCLRRVSTTQLITELFFENIQIVFVVTLGDVELLLAEVTCVLTK